MYYICHININKKSETHLKLSKEMETNFKLNRELARRNGIDERLVGVLEKQEGYGRKGVYVTFNKYHYGDIEPLYLGSAYPNLREHFNIDDEFMTATRVVIDNCSDEICEYLENIED